MPIFGRKDTQTLRKQLIDVLSEMERRDPDIEGSVILRSDGLVLASALRENIDKDLVAAMCASVLNVSKRVSQELDRGGLETAIIRGKKGIIMIMEVSPEIHLAVLAKKDANLGLLLIEMRKAAEKINEILSKL